MAHGLWTRRSPRASPLQALDRVLSLAGRHRAEGTERGPRRADRHPRNERMHLQRLSRPSRGVYVCLQLALGRRSLGHRRSARGDGRLLRGGTSLSRRAVRPHLSPGLLAQRAGTVAMDRILEPELMVDKEQAEAYARADLAQINQGFVDRFRRCFTKITSGAMVDLGCGQADIGVWFARALPSLRITAVDGSRPTIPLARHARAAAGGGDRARPPAARPPL